MDITQTTTPEERAECFHAIMRAVAAKMDGFVYKNTTHPDGYCVQARGELASGKERATFDVSLYVGDYNKANPYRACACGIYPRSAKGETFSGYGDQRPSIHFQLTRTPAQIAADITRRLLPEYRIFFEKVAQWVSNTDKYAATMEAGREAMRALGFTFHDHSPSHGFLYFNRGEKIGECRPEVDVYGGTVDLKVKNLQHEQARLVLEVLNLLPAPAYA